MTPAAPNVTTLVAWFITFTFAVPLTTKDGVVTIPLKVPVAAAFIVALVVEANVVVKVADPTVVASDPIAKVAIADAPVIP